VRRAKNEPEKLSGAARERERRTNNARSENIRSIISAQELKQGYYNDWRTQLL